MTSILYVCTDLGSQIGHFQFCKCLIGLFRSVQILPFYSLDPFIALSTSLPKNKSVFQLGQSSNAHYKNISTKLSRFFRTMYKDLKESLRVSDDKTAFLLHERTVHGIMQVRVHLPLVNNLCNIGFLPCRIDSKSYISNCYFCLKNKCKHNFINRLCSLCNLNFQ